MHTRHLSHMDPTEHKWEQINRAARQVNMKVGRQLRGNQLEAGMKVACYYNSTNEGVDTVEILGFTDNEVQYGKGDIKFKTIKEVFAKYGVKSLQELEQFERDMFAYGYYTYLYARDLQPSFPRYRGPWYYLFEGRWSRGSGAERLSFVELISADPERERLITADAVHEIVRPNRVFLALDDEE